MNGSLRPILAPTSVAVVGASRTPGTIGHEIVASLARCGFTGAVYPVNPKAMAICSIPACPEVAALPEGVDQAIIVVPKELVQGVVEACARKKIPGLVVIMPSTSFDVHGLMLTAGDYPGPVVCLEPKWMYRQTLGPAFPGEPTDPEAVADRLAQAWPEAAYKIVADAGHSAMEPGIRKALVSLYTSIN